MRIFLLTLGIVAVFGIMVLTFVPTRVLKNAGLRGVEWLVHLSAPAQELSPEELLQRLENKPAETIIFDVREQKEYDVSHISGAVQVSPAITEADFTRLYGQTLQGKTVVFYCSVGKRSSDTALRVEASARKSGAAEVVNLRGGIFRWYNSGFPVVNAQGMAGAVHPFNAQWGFFVAQ